MCSDAVSGDKRESALNTIEELQKSLKATGKGSEGMKRSPSMTKRKRPSPARASSIKSLKAETMA